MATEFQIFEKWERFLKWLLNTTDKFPKKIRFTLTTRIDNLALDILERIIMCRYDPSVRQRGLKRINIDIETLRVLLRVCNELRYLSHRQYQYAVLHVNEVGKMVWGWSTEKGILLGQCHLGIPFLGFRIFPNTIRIKRENKKRWVKKFKTRMREFESGVIDEEKYSRCLMSLTEHLKIANTYHFRRRIFDGAFI